MQKLIVVSMPRTGSTLLCEMLAQHPKVLGFGEIFIHEEGAREHYHKLTAKDGHFYRGPKKFHAYMRYLEALAELEGREWLTFKLMDYQEELAWQMIEEDESIKLVYACRHNVLESLASTLRSEKTGIWHARDEQEVEKNKGLVEVPESDLIIWHNRRVSLETRLNLLPNPRLKITYQELSLTPEGQARRMFDFMQLDHHDVKVTQRKLNVTPLSERVLNFEPLARKFEGNSISRYFNE